jgi:predicted RNA-binding Zn-ribbon protein involved in translation (DUF1610 family)
MARAISKGRCRLCGSEYSKTGMSRHLGTCQARKQATIDGVGSKARPARLLHLVVSGRHAPMYWMHLEAPADATLDHLDNFLRDAWLECCGHLSAFTIGGVSYASSVDPDWGMDERTMNVKLGNVIATGDTFHHEYDFGSTTDLTLKVVGERQGPIRGKDIEILAQNDPPPIPCDECGQQATQVCSQCSWGGEGWVCDQCGATHECGEDMLLPVVNSPRVGVCGYTG